MATHDYVIANASGAAVRTDLNNALAAIVSNNSGSSAPSTTYAYQFWADTNANVLKISNSANNAWITLRELDGTMLLEDGSASAPGLSFASDKNTGIFRPSSNELAISANGNERMSLSDSSVIINQDGDDVDFRVESDTNTHALFVKGDTDRVGINKSVPNAKLHVTTADSGVNPNASADDLFVENDGHTGITIGSPSTGTGRISFGDPGDVQVGKILYDHSSNFLSFDTAGSERLRINNGGKLLINTTDVLTSSAAAKLQVQESTGAMLALGRDGTGVTAGDAIGKIAFFGNDAGSYQKCAQIECEADGSHANDDKPSRLVFATTADGASSPTDRMRIANDGGFTHFTDTFFTIRTARTAGSEGAIFVKNAASSLSTGSNAFVVRADGDCENTNNSYGAISDAKLKENIVDASSQWDDIKDLRVRNYNFIQGQTHTQIGVVAQEVETVSPGLVSESPDRDEEGNDLGTTTKSVNYSVLYMKAVKALQEAMERIETLETKVAALEAG